jgi:ribosomal-protein-alanine N-acetyltransferase
MEAKTIEKSEGEKVRIRWMVCRDLEEVLAIEKESFDDPWFEADFIRVLRQRNCIGMVAQTENEVVGFMVYELFINRIHLMNFSVKAECRRKGVGAQMVEKLISKLSTRRRMRIELEVVEGNLRAQLFFRSQGFRAVRILRDFYYDGQTAYDMRYALTRKEERKIIRDEIRTMGDR